ncbi:MAG: tyrosine--tRNA ligase [Sedimentisphaerales bacterium]|nr:tyrosine--tRNA ligase [Sedimentisphaerales bacterium]
METLGVRGFVSQKSDGQLAEKLAESMVLYAGFDPTAESLHIGNLLQIMLLSQFQRHGHRPIALVGGATAMIGDPSGKSQERNLLTQETIARNLEGIKKQLRQFLEFDSGNNAAIMVNNADWIGRFSFVEFLRDVGKHFRVGEMMGKESVRKRLQSEVGMSFTEFSYQLLQAYDFLYLCREYDCRLQVGGDDQWGNIVAGIDLTRKLEGREVYGMTSPLLTTAGGQKFGKTEAGTVWLDADRTSPYEFYQYWVRCDDRDVVNLLKRFTYLPVEQINELEEQVRAEPEKRQAQKVLAEEVTRLVHGEEQVELVRKASQVLFGQEITGLSDRDLVSIFADVPSSKMAREKLNDGYPLLDALCESNLCSSRGDAKKLIKNGGAYVNNIRSSELDTVLTGDSLASETILILRSGKKKYHLIQFV